MDPVAERDQVRAAWWKEKQDKVVYGFLVEPQNQDRAGMMWRPSYEWDWRGGCIESVGFAVVHQKTVGVTWLSHKTKTGGSVGGDGIRARREASKWATRGMIEVLALGGHKGSVDARPSDGELHVLTKIPL
jgi:hypothetical protein